MRVPAAVALVAVWLPARPLTAQTDYYNTDAGRPIRIEDAYAIERRAFEIQAAPLRLERAQGGAYSWAVEPELTLGILPRTQIEIGLPFAYIDAAGSGTSGLAGVELSALYNLNAETSIPALAVAGSVLVPAGGLAPNDPYASVKGIATKTLPEVRFHINAEYTFGTLGNEAGSGVAELSRWIAGIAADHTFPLQAMLLTAEVYARDPLRTDEELQWNAAGGVRYQLSPRVTLDGGGGRRLTGDDRAWFATFGIAYALGLPWRPR